MSGRTTSMHWVSLGAGWEREADERGLPKRRQDAPDTTSHSCKYNFRGLAFENGNYGSWIWIFEMPTATTLPLILLVAVLWKFTKGQLLSIVLFTSVFDAASAVNFGALGVTPWLFALFIGLAIRITRGHKPFRFTPDINRLSVLLLVLFILYSAWSSFVYPFVFHGAMVLNSHNTSPTSLSWGISNLAQLCYLLAVAVVYLSALGISREALASALQWYVRGCIVVALFAIYQLANATLHVPYPSSVLYSNTSHVIYPAYMINGMWRLNSTFPEASEMATYMCPAIALLGWDVVMRPFRLVRMLSLVLMIATLLLTVSSLGYICFSFLLLAAPVLYAVHTLRSRALAPVKVVIAIVILGLGTTIYMTTNVSATINKAVRGVLLDKENSDSYRDRSSMNDAAMETAAETYFMGAGWGSARASGLMFVLISNVGAIGVLLFLAFVASLFLPMFRGDTALRDGVSTHLYEKSLLALMVMLVGLLAAGAEPVAPILWALFAAATTGKPQTDTSLVGDCHDFYGPAPFYLTNEAGRPSVLYLE